MSFPNVSDVIATTLESRGGQVRDNVRKNNALLAQLNRKGKGRKTFSGGRLIYEELSFQANPNGGWYSGYDLLPVSAADVITAAEFAIKQYAVAVSVSGLELLQNNGKEQVIDLIDSRMDVAEATMANAIGTGLYGDGATGVGGAKAITGMDAAVPEAPTSGTYGGIDRAAWSFWQSQLYDPASTPTATTIQAYMNTLWAKCVRGSDRPDLILSGGTIWATYMASLQALQRFTGTETAALGFPSVKYMDADVVLDGGIGGGATATDMYFLNTKYIHYRPHSQRDQVPLDPSKRYAINQDAHCVLLGWAGNLTMSGSQFQGRLKGD